MLYGLFFTLISIVQFIACQNIPSVPCPDIFEYIFDGYKWKALIKVPTPDTNTVEMSVSFIVGELGLKGFGNLTLVDKDNAIQNIRNYQPFQYTVTLPQSETLPQVTEIKYNGNVVCTGHGLEPPYSTFWRSYIFKWWSSDITFPRHDKPSKPSVIKPTPTPPKPTPTTPKPTPIPTPPTPTPTSPTPTPTPTPSQVIDFKPPTSSNNKKKFTNHRNCGTLSRKRQKRADVVPFIYNGQEIPRNDHPWLSALYDTTSGFLFFCGGNLISNKHVLSAAHCTRRKQPGIVKVKLGAHFAMQLFDEGSVLRDVSNIINHQEYNTGSAHADISLLTLNEDVEITPTIKPICLWTTEEDISIQMGNTGTIMGWGLTENGQSTTTPLQTDVRIASQQQCRSVEALQSVISDETFCAGTKGSGPCMGDSGGGLLLRRHGRWYLRGVISTSLGNIRLSQCDVNTYSVYVDTAKYLDWITNYMK